MTDREKVIKGLECCITDGLDCPNDCPYIGDCNRKQLHTDALDLLKAQEPHIMTLEEWREWKRKPLSQRDPVYYVDNKGLGSWINPNDQLFIYATPELGYGVLFVCWTSRPTDEQMEAIPWN